MGITQMVVVRSTFNSVTIRPLRSQQGHTSFQFDLSINTKFRIDIYDVSGRHIKTLEGLASGNAESVRWDLKDNTGSASISF